nr:tetratricopeptide repeat protein [Rubripirellula sp.]
MDKKLKLWNPNAAANWSLIFSPIFGGWVHAKNWRELGQKDKAQESMLWVYVTLASLVVRLFTGWGAEFLILVLWYFLSAKAQVKFLRENNISYEKKTWDKPLAIGFLGWVIYLLAHFTFPALASAPPTPPAPSTYLLRDTPPAPPAYLLRDTPPAPAPPAPTPPALTPDKQATTAVSAPDFAATKKAAESGDATAQFNLGKMYESGQGVPQDYADAMKWYRLAADQGYAKAQINIGVMYDNGQGVPQDYAEAMKWYRLAADQGFAAAQYNLGVMYAIGQGVPQDDAEAAKWYRLAADQGHAAAQFNLGVMYANGQGVPQDYAESYAWFSVAAAGGDADAANNREIAAGELTPEQLSQGQKRATELFEKISGGK